MQLASVIDLHFAKEEATGYGIWYGGPGSGCVHAGGPGSGCNPDVGVCGRPPGHAGPHGPANKQDIGQSVAKKFERYEKMVRAVDNKKINGLAVFGERGIGKSKTVIDQLTKTEGLIKIKGTITPKELFNVLSANRDPDAIVWFDDADSAFKDTTSLNILKAALDSDEPREISWLSSKDKEEEQTFRFQGRIIVTTNIQLDTNEHVAALVDRMHWINLKLSPEEKMHRIEQVAPKMLKHLDAKTQKDIISWIKDNKDEIGGNLSLRTVKKLGDLATIDDDWKDLADPILEEGRREAEKSVRESKVANRTAKEVSQTEERTGAPIKESGKKMPMARENKFAKIMSPKGFKKTGTGQYESKKGSVKFDHTKNWTYTPAKGGAEKSGSGMRELKDVMKGL